jgi:Allantoicase
MEMHAEHTYSEQLKNLGPITHIRLNLFPDGGVSRIRVLGKVAK